MASPQLVVLGLNRLEPVPLPGKLLADLSRPLLQPRGLGARLPFRLLRLPHIRLGGLETFAGLQYPSIELGGLRA